MEFDPGELRPSRLEWWGGSKDIIKEGLLRPLLVQTLVRLEHATLDERDKWDEQDPNHLAPDNVLFTLADGRRWELLDAQNSDMQVLLFKEIRSDAEITTSGDLERGPEEQPFTVPLEGIHLPLPWTVVGITEVWTIYDGHQILKAVVLWGDPTVSINPGPPSRYSMTPLLAFYVSYDGFWITTAEKVLAALERDLFVMRNMHYHFYDLKQS